MRPWLVSRGIRHSCPEGCLLCHQFPHACPFHDDTLVHDQHWPPLARLMAASPLQPDFCLTDFASAASLPPSFALPAIAGQGLPKNGRFGSPSRRPAKVCTGEIQGSTAEDGMSPQGLQEFLWRQFFSDQSQWWDNRRSKKTPRHPDFRHKKSKSALWLDNSHKPAWVESQLAMWDAGIRPPESAPTSTEAPHEGDLNVRTCKKLCEDGEVTEAVDALNLLVQRGRRIPNNLFYRVLKRCTAQKDLILGRRIHALTVESGYEGDTFLATHLISLYASHGQLEEAMGVFSKVPKPDAHNWASIIFAYSRKGESRQAIELYRQMCESTVQPGSRAFVAVLTACASSGNLAAGKDVHAHILAVAGKPDMFVQTCLLDMYAKCGSLEDARRVFDGLPRKDVVSWTAMIAGYAQQGMGQEALRLYSGMEQEGITPPASVTFVCLLQACANAGVASLHQGKQLHAQIEGRDLQDDVVVGASLVNMYAKCGSLEDARRVFDRLPKRNVVTWNAMVAGYAQQGLCQEALNLYSSMQKEGTTSPNAVTFVCLLQACATVGVGALCHAKQIHAQIEERGLQDDVVVGASLVNMYVKCGSVKNGQCVFDRLSQKNVVTWTAMIAGYTRQGMGQEALSLYSIMQQEGITAPNSVTFLCLLQACATVGATALPLGKQLHAQIEEGGLQDQVILGASLLNMYAKCGSIGDAQEVFERLSHKDVVTWTTMIAGYAQLGLAEEALGLYSAMQQEGLIVPNSVTYICLLQACATLAALPLGKLLHAEIEEKGLQANPDVGQSLVNMYAKCGSMVDSQQVFDSLHEQDVATWGALVAGYTRQGDSESVFELVDRMEQEGVHPNGVTFLSVLTVCSHAGLVDKGRTHFQAMNRDYGISPTIEHYTCMVDLLARAGQLDEALQMVKTMPFQPDGAVWLTLLGACQKWSNVEVGRQAFEFAVRLDEASAYVLMSNIYASAEMWDEVQEMQAKRVKSRACKQPGRSWWTDTSGVVHAFVVGDRETS